MTFQPRGIAPRATAPIPPPLGTVQRGELLVDAQTRTLWLGVETVINPAGAILISDNLAIIQALQDQDVALRAYVDAQIATRAPLSHTHLANDITDLDDAIETTGGSIPPYCIIFYSGDLAMIPVGYVICDGNNGTPNMSERFVIGYHTQRYPYKSTGGATPGASVTTGTAGAHSHGGTVQYHALTLNEMPVHTHSVYDPAHYHPLVDPGHTHTYYRGSYGGGNIYAGGSYGAFSPSEYYTNTGSATMGGYANYVATNISIYNNGGGAGHNHVLTTDGGHTHTVAMNLPPYYALAYIMKLP